MQKSRENFSSPLTFKTVRNKNPRNSFDLSYHSYFTSPAGTLLPSFCLDVVPGDYVELDVSNFTRTLPVNTASFARMTEYTDFYFVPFRLIWRWFDQLIEAVPYVDTSLSITAAANNSVAMCPYFDSKHILDFMANYKSRTIICAGLVRMLDLLGYYSSSNITYSSSTHDAWVTQFNSATRIGENYMQFSVFRLLAYNRLFFDYYRNSDYEQVSPTIFNCDNLNSGGRLDPSTFNALTTYFGSLPSCQYGKDMFTSVKPSLLYHSGQSASLSPVFPPNHSTQSNFNISDSYVSGTAPAGSATSSQVRNILALDKLARISMSAPKTFRDQQLAHFGVKQDNCDYCSTRYLGSFRSDINIGEVVASTNYQGSDSSNYLGQVAGKGVSSSNVNGIIKASFTEFGIIMGIHYVRPAAEYNSSRLDIHNQKFSRNDYYVPEFDQLGLQPLFSKQVGYSTAGNLNTAIGYTSRYLEYKTKVDEVHGNFQRGRSLSPWAIPRVDLDDTLVSGSWFHVSPNVTDTLFPVNYNGTEVTDPFLCHYRYDCRKVSNMSINGIPSI